MQQKFKIFSGPLSSKYMILAEFYILVCHVFKSEVTVNTCRVGAREEDQILK
jgi:hypothetical protein